LGAIGVGDEQQCDECECIADRVYDNDGKSCGGCIDDYVLCGIQQNAINKLQCEWR